MKDLAYSTPERMPQNTAEAVNACVAVRFNCLTVLYALQSYKAIAENGSVIKSSNKPGEFWGRVQLSFQDQIVITAAKIFEPSKYYPQETYQELLTFAKANQIPCEELSESETNFLEKLKTYRDKHVAHHERIDSELLVSNIGDTFWLDATNIMPIVIGKSLRLCESICAKNGIFLEVRQMYDGYHDTIRWIGVDNS